MLERRNSKQVRYKILYFYLFESDNIPDSHVSNKDFSFFATANNFDFLIFSVLVQASELSILAPVVKRLITRIWLVTVGTLSILLIIVYFCDFSNINLPLQNQ